jgi:hypothetical protein
MYSCQNQIFDMRCNCNDLKNILNYNISIVLAINILKHSNKHCNYNEFNNSFKTFQQQLQLWYDYITFFNYSISISFTIFSIHNYNMFSQWLQYVLSAVTIFSICDYNPNRPSSSPMTNLRLEPPLQPDNMLVSLALHAAVATTVSITTIATATMNPPHGGSTKARMMVATRKPRSTPRGGERCGAPGSAPRWRDLSSMMVVSSESIISSLRLWGRRGFSHRRAATMTSRSALSGGPEVAQATPTGSLHSAARGQRGAGQERWTGGRRGGGSDVILSRAIPT